MVLLKMTYRYTLGIFANITVNGKSMWSLQERREPAQREIQQVMFSPSFASVSAPY